MSVQFELAVVGRGLDTAAIAGAAGHLLALRASPRSALIATVGPGAAGGAQLAAPASGAARGLQARLSARAIESRATGRVVWAGFGDAAELPRAVATARPAILAVCGARPAWVEPLLDGAALVLVAASPDAEVTTLALAELARRGLRAAPVAAPSGMSARLARIGVPTAGARRAVAPALAGAAA